MAKLTLSSILSKFSSITALNDNFSAIAAAMENTLSRDGTSPNAMGADLDMDSNKIINLPDATTNTEPVTLGQIAGEIADASIDWTGAWTTATAYVVNQAVSNGGSSYICTVGHTSTAADEPGVGGSWATKWNVLSAKGDTGATGATGANGVFTGLEATVTLDSANDKVPVYDNSDSDNPKMVAASDFGGGGGSLWWFSPPTTSSLSTAVTDGTFVVAPAASDDADAGLIVTGLADANGEGYLRLTTAPSAPFSVTTRVRTIMRADGHFTAAGLSLRESSSGRKVVFGGMGNGRYGGFRATGATLPADIILGGNGTGQLMADCSCWFRADVDASFNVTLSISPDGKSWTQVASVTAATIGWSSVDQVGVGLHVRTNPGGSTAFGGTFEHFTAV